MLVVDDHRKLHSLSPAIHGGEYLLRSMSKGYICEGLYVIVVGLSLSLFVLNVSAQNVTEELRSIESEIDYYNVLNKLELNKEQIRIVLKLAFKARNIILHEKEMVASKEKELLALYKQVLMIVKKRPAVVPEDILQKIEIIKESIDKTKLKRADDLLVLVLDVKKALILYQLYALVGYIHKDYNIILCERENLIGQSGCSEGLMKELDNAHFADKDRYSFERHEIVERIIYKLKTFSPPGYVPWKEDDVKLHLLKYLDEAHALSDGDFAVMKEGIAKKIQTFPPYKIDMFNDSNLTQKILHYLLNPDVIPILMSRIKMPKVN